MYHLIEYCFVWHGATADCPEACLAKRVLAKFCVAGIGNFGEHLRALALLNRPLLLMVCDDMLINL